MSLIWNKIEPDHTKDYLHRFQNRSMIPDSEAYYIQSDIKPVDESEAHLLVSKQSHQVTVPKGKTVWYATDKGGIFVHSRAEIAKLENYNITSVQDSVTVVGEPVTIDVPEGANITIQNLSDTNAGFKLADSTKGTFILTERQMFSESFSKAGVVTLIPSSDSKPSEIVYSITPSAVITKLSHDMQTKLNEMSAAVDLIFANSVTHDEIESFVAATHHNKWSEPSFKQFSRVRKLVSRPFVGNTAQYHSRAIADQDEFHLLIDLNLNWLDDDGVTQEGRGFLYLEGSYRQAGTHKPVIVNCNNVNVGKLIDSVTLSMAEDKNEINVAVNLNKDIETGGVSTMVRFENGYYEVKEEDPQKDFYISTFEAVTVNLGINFSDDKFNVELLDRINKSYNVGSDIAFNIDSVETGNSIIGDDTSNDLILTAPTEDKFQLIIREINNTYSLVHIYSKVKYPYDMDLVRAVEFARENIDEDLFFNMKHLVESKEVEENGEMVTVTTKLLPLFRKYDYISDMATKISSKNPQFITLRTEAEVQ